MQWDWYVLSAWHLWNVIINDIVIVGGVEASVVGAGGVNVCTRAQQSRTKDCMRKHIHRRLCEHIQKGWNLTNWIDCTLVQIVVAEPISLGYNDRYVEQTVDDAVAHTEERWTRRTDRWLLGILGGLERLLYCVSTRVIDVLSSPTHAHVVDELGAAVCSCVRCLVSVYSDLDLMQSNAVMHVDGTIKEGAGALVSVKASRCDQTDWRFNRSSSNNGRTRNVVNVDVDDEKLQSVGAYIQTWVCA